MKMVKKLIYLLLLSSILAFGCPWMIVPARAADSVAPGGGGMLFLRDKGGASISIPLNGTSKDKVPDKKDETMQSIIMNRTEIMNLINGILDLEKEYNLAVNKAQAKKLLPILKRIANTDLLGLDNGLTDPEDAKEMAKRTDDCLISLEDILTPKQLGAIDEKLMNNPQMVATGGAVMMHKGGGGMPGLGKGITSLTQEDIEKIKKEAEAAAKKMKEEERSNLEKCIKLLEKKAS